MIARQYHLIRREIWEHRALYVTPFVIGLVVLLGTLAVLVAGGARGVGFATIVDGMKTTGVLGSVAGIGSLVAAPASIFTVGLAFLVFFYSIDALYAERKNRSILFWKSLPLTDTEVVISKLVTAVIVAPLLTFGFLVVTQIFMLALSSIAVWLGGGSAWELVWEPLPLFQFWTLSVYSLLGASLWFLPFVAWALFCSAFARKNVFLWTVLPFVVIPMAEQIIFGSGVFARIVYGRFGELPWFRAGSRGENFNLSFDETSGELVGRIDLLAVLDLAGFLTTPGLWGGLLVAAGFTAGAIYFRRYRDDTGNG